MYQQTGILKASAFFILIVSFQIVHAQKYVTAAGLRFSNGGTGATLQQRIYNNTTLEAVAVVNIKEYSFTALFEKHNNILWGKGFNTYLGIGPQYGYYYNETGNGYFAIDGVIGIEFKFPLLPLVFSADMKPLYRFNETYQFDIPFGVSVRLILIKDKNTLFNKNK